MSYFREVRPGDWESVRINFQRLGSIVFGTGASPTFAGLTLSGLTASTLIGADASKGLESVTIGTGLDYTRPTLSFSHLGIEDLTDPGGDRILFWDDSETASGWLAVGNSLAITTTTLDTIQDIRTSASPTFVGLTLSGLTAGRIPFVNTSSVIADDSDLLWDNTNKRLGLGAITPSYRLSVGSDNDTYQVGIYHDNSNAYIKWTEGLLTLSTDKGTNTSTYVDIKGKGTGSGLLRVYDEDDEEYVYLWTTGGYAYLEVGGTSPQGLLIQSSANVPIRCFHLATEGETPEFKITGYRTGDASRTLEIGVGIDAADTVSFDGLTNYWFDGNVDAQTAFEVAGTQVLNGTTLGATVVNSSLTSVGTIGTGVWQGTSISTTYTDAKCTATWPNTYSADQNLLQASSPTFAALSLGTGELTCGSINRATGTLTLEIGGTAEISITSTTVTLGGNLIIPNSGTIGSVGDTDVMTIDSSGNTTFSVFPITPSAAPDADYEVANKKYVDDEVAGGVGADEKVKIDAAATAGYIGAASNDGVLRTTTGLSYADGGDFVTLGLSHLGFESLSSPAPNDRIVFWDNSASALAWLSASTGLAISGTALGLNISGLTADATPDGAADYVATYDASGSTHKKVLLNNLPGGETACCRATMSEDLTVPNQTWTALALDQTDFDTESAMDTVNYKYIIPEAGKWLICGGAAITDLADGDQLSFVINVNGSSAAGYTSLITGGAATLGITGADILDLAVDDEIEVMIWHNFGANRTAPAASYTNCLAVHKLS